MATDNVSAASWSKKIVVTADGTTTYLVPTIASKMGVCVTATTGAIAISKTLGSPDRIKAGTAIWTVVTQTSGEATIDMPVSAIRVVGSGGAAGEVFLIQ